MGSLPKPVVLAITRDTGVLRAARLEMPLVNMKRQGLIHDFFITTPVLFDVPDDMLFDVIWLQRPTNSLVLDHLEKKLGGMYMADLDDLLIGRSSYLDYELFNKHIVLDAVRRCRVLTVTSARLAGLYEKAVGESLESKTVVCPNGFEFPDRVRTPAEPEGLLFVSGDPVPLTTSSSPILGAVRDFSDAHGMPVYFFGRETEPVDEWFNNVVHIGRVPFWHYHALLNALPSMIGIAPMETHADQDTLEFISGKSDIKMVDFAGSGHPAVYSNALPYIDTDIKAGLVTENTADAWRDALEAVYGSHWRMLADEQAEVIRERNMNRLARECWYKAVTKARLEVPIKGAELKPSSGMISFFVDAARHMILSQDHLLRNRLKARIHPKLLSLLTGFVREK
ncbi:MAG: hypothetical protein V2B18_03810 [Pseudomonadota bacterium]